jgi:type IV pilus assembly protein PilO
MNLAEIKDQLQNLDIKDVGNWPIVIKTGAIIIICIIVLAAGFWFDTRSQLDELDQARKKEESLKADFKVKAHKAANLAVYKQQMEEMKRSFGTMLRQLPSKTEIAELLVDISQTGLSNGLEFELFKPEAEVPEDFYAVLPIKIKVTGDYHEFGKFVSDVAVLPRIVTLHDINITPVKDDKNKAKNNNGNHLTMEVTAKTYRYLEEEGQ